MGKHLKKVDNKLVNQFGVSFTTDERNKWNMMIDTANAKRNRMKAKEKDMYLFFGGKETGGKVYNEAMGRESDFLIKEKNRDLQRFRNRKEFENYFHNLEKINTHSYVKNRVKQYRQNFMEAMENQHFPERVMKKINNLTQKEFMEFARTEQVANFQWIYDEVQREGVISGIETSLDRFQR